MSLHKSAGHLKDSSLVLRHLHTPSQDVNDHIDRLLCKLHKLHALAVGNADSGFKSVK